VTSRETGLDEEAFSVQKPMTTTFDCATIPEIEIGFRCLEPISSPIRPSSSPGWSILHEGQQDKNTDPRGEAAPAQDGAQKFDRELRQADWINFNQIVLQVTEQHDQRTQKHTALVT
jgi:hypothetical protein